MIGSVSNKQVKMSQSNTEVQVASVEVAPVAEKKLKVQRKSKKMMMTEVPVIPEKIEMDLPQSAGGSVSQQASQMSQTAVVRKITVSKSKKQVKIVPREVSELVEELVVSAIQIAEENEKKIEKKRKAIEKAKATREANKLKKKQQEEEERLAREAEEAEETETEDEGEEYEVSNSKRPIQKEKEGRVLEGRIEAVEGEVKKELKVLKMKLGDLIKEDDDEVKIEEKKWDLLRKKASATSRVHHKIAEVFNTSVVVARRSEAGKGEKKNFASKGVQLKDATTEKLFWANCERILPHFTPQFKTYASAKKEYTKIVQILNTQEDDEKFCVEKLREAKNKFYALFTRATEALVCDRCDVIEAERKFQDNTYRKLVLATHLSVQGIYVVRRVENQREVPLVLRNSRDELIEIGNANEVMSVIDLVHHSKTKVLSLGDAVLRKLCGAVANKIVAPVRPVAVAVAENNEFLMEFCE